MSSYLNDKLESAAAQGIQGIVQLEDVLVTPAQRIDAEPRLRRVAQLKDLRYDAVADKYANRIQRIELDACNIHDGQRRFQQVVIDDDRLHKRNEGRK